MLQVKNIAVCIGHKKIIDDLSFQVQPGDIVGLVGPNGAGKTTIMKTILGLTNFQGQIIFANQKITENNHTALAQVGALIEHPAIYPFLTGLQNLELYSYSHEDLLQVISRLQMEHYISKQSKNYSLGMKQKLGIAIALLNHPQLVILDEPLNGLDIEATIGIRKIIQQYAEQGTAFLISSHVLSELQKIMTRLILINDGQIIIDQALTEIRNLNQCQYKLLTTNLDKTVDILSKHHLPVKKNENYLLINHTDIFKVQDLLYVHNLRLLELEPQETNFEKIIVNLLEQQRRQTHDNYHKTGTF